MKEIWKEIPGFPGYEVSNQGQVRSYFYSTGKGWKIAESPQRILRPSRSQLGGYYGVNLHKNGKTHRRRIGRLVLLAFVGPLPDGMEMCHNDGDLLNDRLDNLRYDSHIGNMRDVSRHGRSTGPKPKLNQEEVHTIRTEFASGEYSRMELAEKYKVSYWLIRHVLNGQCAYKGGPGPIQKYTRLNDQQAETLREERASGKSLANLAEKYGISISGVSLIASGKRHSKAAGPLSRSSL